VTEYAAAPHAVQRVRLDPGDVLRRTWQLYKRLFVRSLMMAGMVFGVLNIAEALFRSGTGGTLLGLFAVVLSIAGTALLEGGLVEIVRGLHADGDDDASVGDALNRASGRLMKLVCVTLLNAFGIALGFLLFVVPGLVLMTRWAIAVPVAMLEEGNARDALRRSREMVDGNGWNVFQVFIVAGLLTGVVTVPFAIVGAHAGVFGWWLAFTISSMLTAPYWGHAFTVVYYTLAEPERPVVLDPGHRWQSVWDEQTGADVGADETVEKHESPDDEYQRRFDEHERQWGDRN
jgi:Membrane domain of glycerophosphoryl diester phosphodiesterase